MSALSMVADRICQQSNRTVELSTQEILSCDKGNYGCEGGYVTRALNWGKRKGFIPEACYPYQANKTECDVDDHLETNECRANNMIYKVVDFCLA
jgi:cathepsin B